MQKIDFVLPWVDGSDEAWLKLKQKYMDSSVHSNDIDATAAWRYKDYGLLKYWFRGVERFAPWVNRVFFVTCGQKPDWLDESNPKLRLVNHKEYIPAEYLPTFQSFTIELNLHRIPDLSEQFVLFNDDMFLLQPLKPEFFFKKGFPVIPCDLGIPYWMTNDNIGHIIFNDFMLLRRSIDVERLVWKNIWKFIDVRSLGFSRSVKNFLVFAITRTIFQGDFGHMPYSHLKSTFEEIWCKRHDEMDRASRNRFRCDDCICHWLACAWNMVSGRFFPANEERRRVFFLVNQRFTPEIRKTIQQQSFPTICLGDKANPSELEQCFAEVSGEFDKLFPEKSSFEK